MVAITQLLFRKKHQARIVNLVTFEGTSPNSEEWILCYGFTQDGKPVIAEREIGKAMYRIGGLFYGSIALNPLITRRGKRLGELLGISEEEAKALIQPLRHADNVNFYKLHNTYGMYDHYNCEDKWMVDTEIPKVDYQAFNDLVLKRIKSQWRIYTPKISQLLRKKEFQKIMGMEE